VRVSFHFGLLPKAPRPRLLAHFQCGSQDNRIGPAYPSEHRRCSISLERDSLDATTDSRFRSKQFHSGDAAPAAADVVAPPADTGAEPQILAEAPPFTELPHMPPRVFLGKDEIIKFYALSSLPVEEWRTLVSESKKKSIAITGEVDLPIPSIYSHELAQVTLYGWNRGGLPKSLDLQFIGSEGYQRVSELRMHQTVTVVCLIDDISLMNLYACLVANP
jgi:hypothetical protein